MKLLTGIVAAVLGVAPLQAAPYLGSPAASVPPAVGQGAQETTAADGSGVIEKQALARATGEPVELVGRRTADSTTWTNPDGSFTTEFAAQPFRVRDEHGEWTPVDTTLVRSGEGWAPKATIGDVQLSGGGQQDFAALSTGDDSMSLGFGWAGSLPAPEVNGSTALYRDVLPDADLMVNALPGGFAESVVLRERPSGPVVIRIPVTLDGLDLDTESDRLALTTAAGRLVASAPPPLMWDAQREEGSGDPLNQSPVAMAVDDNGVLPVIELRPNPSYLSDPTRVYPVTIDPTTTLTVSTDTWVSIDHPTSAKGSTEFQSGTNNAGANKARSLVKFNIDAIAGKTVTDADLRLYERYSYSCSPSEVWARRITQDWNSQDVTWGTIPSAVATDGASVTTAHGYNSTCGDDWVHFDVKSIVSRWAAGTNPNYGFLIRAADETDSNGWKKFDSTNFTGANGQTGTRPKLVVTYNLPPDAPVNNRVSPCPEPCTPAVTNTTQPSFKATATDPDGGQVKLNVEIRKVGTTSPVYTASSAFFASGNQGTVTAPYGSLTDGNTYEYRLQATDGLDSSAWTTWSQFQVLVDSGAGSEVPLSITTDTVWGPTGSPYIIRQNVLVASGTTLTMLPGTVVKYLTGTIRVQGTLIADGTAANPITLTSIEDDSIDGDTNADGAATTPAPGNYGRALAFEDGTGTGARAAAEARATSILDNVAIHYGSADSGGFGCAANTAAIAIGSWGRVHIARTEFESLMFNAITVAAQSDGIGDVNVSASRFADSVSGCALEAVNAGTFSGNVFEESDNWNIRNLGLASDAHVQYYNNWFYGPISIQTQSPYGRDKIDFRNNAFLGSWTNYNGTYYDPNDISENWWGYPVNEGPYCYVPNYIPPLLENRLVGYGECPETGEAADGKYFTTVLPALQSPPPLVEAGLAGDPVVPAMLDAAQLYGSGSEFGYRPAGFQADPVNSANGSFTAEVADVAVPARGVGLSVSRTYNSADATVGSLGRGWAFGYDIGLSFPDAATVVLRAGDGQQVRFFKQGDGSFVPAAGGTATLKAVGSSYTVSTRAGLVYTFTTAGKISSIRDRAGATVSFSYVNGVLSRVSNGGRGIDLAYTNGLLTKATVADGRYVGFGYTNGLLTSVRGLDGQTTSYAYTNQKLTKQTDPLGHDVLRLAYDPGTGRVSDQWDALNQHTSFGWDPGTGTSTMTDPRGKTWKDVYTNNVLVKRVDPLGRTTSYEYDPDLQLAAATDPRGFRSVFSYNAAGDLVMSQGPNGTVSTTYNADHNPVKTVNPRGNATTYTYNADGLVTAVKRTGPDGPDSNVTSYSYDTSGQLATSTTPRGKTTTYSYWPDGDLKTVTTPTGYVTSYGYDVVGRLTSVLSPRGNLAAAADQESFTTHYDYFDDDQPKKVTDPLDRTVVYGYDADGRLTSLTDAKGRVSTYTYYDNGQVKDVQGPDPTIPATHYTYDPTGNLASLTDPAGRTVTHSYDDAGQEATTTTPVGTYSYGLDKAGNLTSVTAPGGLTTTMDYTAAGLLRMIDYPTNVAGVTNTADVTFGYDADGNRKTMTDGAGTVTYTYDPLDRLTQVSRGSQTFTYTYKADGLLDTVVSPTGTQQVYNYYNDGQLKNVSTALTGNTPALQATYTYNADGLPATAILNGDGSGRSYSYDNADRLTGLVDTKANGTKILDDTYTLDDADNPTTITHTAGTASTDTYTYDLLDRLTGACYGTTSCTGATDYVKWGYDSVGNRTSETRPAGTTTYTYDPAKGWLNSLTKPGGATTNYSYNALGEQTTATTGAATTGYTYNAAGRMTTATTAGGATTGYSYDGDGRRLTTTSAGVTTNSLWDPRSYQLAAETDATNTRIRDYTYGLGPVGYYGPGGTSYYYHTDTQGSIREVTKTDGTSAWRYDYEPYGIPRSSTKLLSTAATNPIGWAGQYADPDTGQTHLRARQYDPTTGAFTTPDPAAAAPASATYTYANANPMTGSDPSGLWPDWGGIVDTVVDTAVAAAPYVSVIAGTGAMVFPPAAPVLGPIALGAGLITAADSAYDAVQACSPGGKNCGTAILNASINTALAVAGGGAAIRGLNTWRTQRALTTAANGGRTVAMGRNMPDRVIPYAQKNGYDWYKGTPGWVPRGAIERVSPRALERTDLWFNKRWIKGEMRSGSKIMDIGEPPGYPPSSFYNMERQQVRGYWNYFQDFQP